MPYSNFEESDYQFTSADYAVFLSALLIFSGFGIWTGIRGIIRQAKNKDGSPGSQRELSVVAVSFSLLSSLFHAPILLGSPAEIYMNGTDYMFIIIGYALGIAFAAYFIIKRIYELGLTSVYEYFELRFSFAVRLVGVLIFMLQTLVILSNAIYGPGLVLSQVMGIPIEVSTILVGLVGTIYITIGGLKGVVWVDVAQMLLIFVMMVVVMVGGFHAVGGSGHAFHMASAGGRLTTPQLNPNPTIRISVWTQVLGGAVSIAGFYCSQTMAQKTLGLPSLKLIYSGSLCGCLMAAVYITIVCILGIITYVYNILCDPVTTNTVDSPDQLLPLLVMQLYHTSPGVTGVFVAAVFGSTLSNVGGGVNAMAALTMLNVVNPIYKKRKGEDMLESRPFIAALYFKIIAAIWGVLTVIGAYIGSVTDARLVQLFFSIIGILTGPLLGTFILGIFFPMANHWGALMGLLSSFFIAMWMYLGATFTGVSAYHAHPLPLYDVCPNNTDISTYESWAELNTTGRMINAVEDVHMEPSGLGTFYSISFMYYGLLAVIINVVVGLLVSLITGVADRQVNTDPRLGYLWWYEASEPEPLPALDTKAKQAAIQKSLQQEAKVLVSSLSNQSLATENRKQMYKLKRQTSASSVSLNRGMSHTGSGGRGDDAGIGSVPEEDEGFCGHQAGGGGGGNGVVWSTGDDAGVFVDFAGSESCTSEVALAEGVWYKL